MKTPPRCRAFALSGAIATACLATLACTGQVSGEGTGGSPIGSGASGGASGVTNAGQSGLGGGGTNPTNQPAFQAASGMLRRLTRAQFRNAVSDVFGVEVNVNELDSDSWNGNFAAIGASSVVTSERGVEQYHTAIEAAVATVFADDARRTQLLGCTPSGQTGDTCVRGFIQSMGRRAWRRPLEVTEVERLVTLAESASTELGSALEGLRWATVAMFTSPSFLYRAELGAPGAGGPSDFTSYEMASRLAFLLWNSLPDSKLLDDAEKGALASADGIRASTERLLDVPAGRQAVGEFAEEYMRLDRVLTQAKDAALFPEYGPALQAAMVRDMRGVWEAIAFDDRASALELFSTTKVLANAELARLYGLDTTGLDSSTFRVLALPADSPRIGILGKAGLLSQFANQKEGSPTLRGKFIRDALMCMSIPPPPGDVTAMLEEPAADQPMTKRQRLEQHRSKPTCAGCHGLMDPLGLPLETFDAIGRYRTTEHDLPIDPSGELDGQAVANARELGLAMSSSETVARCMVSRYYSYAVGFEQRDVDAGVIDALATSFKSSGFQLRQLVLDTVTHPAFAAVAPQP